MSDTQRPCARRIRALQYRVETTGRPGVIRGLTGACTDCTGTGEILVLPGRRLLPRIFHDAHCPVLVGATEWQPHPID
jgi:hypothetical protein